MKAIPSQDGQGPYRSGFVAVVGRPNVGKSTLINALIGSNVAIASSRPETTRKAIRGILTTENAQMVLVDTPGIHRPRTLLGQRLNDVVEESLSDVDEIAFLLPADQEIGPGDRRILSRLRSEFWRGPWPQRHADGSGRDDDDASAGDHGGKRGENDVHSVGKLTEAGWKVPVIAVVTKIDTLSSQQLVAKLIEIDEFADFTELVPVSAPTGDNLKEIGRVFLDHLPVGPQMYPDDQISEERPEDQIAELIRGAFLEELDDELPHSLAVVVDSIERPQHRVAAGLVDDGKAHVLVSIYVERDSQKPIIIGRHAEHLVQVKKRLRTAVNRIVGTKAKLELHVAVAKGWQSDPKQLERLGF